MSWAYRVKRTGLALSLALGGCATPGPGSWGDAGFRGRAATQAAVLPDAAATPTPLDLTDLPAAIVGPSSAGQPDRGLGERECLELAARNSMLGNLLDAKARSCGATATEAQRAQHGEPVPPSPADMQSEILAVAAIEARSASAGTAMELYYRLAQAQAQRAIVEEGLAVIDRALEESKLLETKGIRRPETFEVLQRRSLTLRDQQLELDRGIAQLSAELRRTLNLGPTAEEWLVRPTLAVKVDPTVVDPAAAIQDGLARRPELNLLRRLDQQQSPETLRTLRAVLGSAQPLLTLSCRPVTPSCWTLLGAALGKGYAGQELDGEEQAGIRAAWDVYRLDREQEITKELRVAANDVLARLNQVVVARDQLTTWNQRLERLQTESKNGIANYSDRVEANLKRLEAQSVLWEKVFAWDVAVVKLRQAQFTLLP
ncbi:MAG: hypothetical protein P4L84_27685 [Isosphaeraceae bacterium]|nr:hypothetical protein [Isosphaeraceae bacterium]